MTLRLSPRCACLARKLGANAWWCPRPRAPLPGQHCCHHVQEVDGGRGDTGEAKALRE